MTWFVLFIILFFAVLLLGLLFLGYKAIWAFANRLTPIENFLPFPRVPVRVSALIFGVLCWSSLFVYLASGDRWRTFRGDYSIELTTLTDAVVRSSVSRSTASDLISNVRKLNRVAGIESIPLHGDQYVALVRKAGMWPLEEVTDQVPENLNSKIYVQDNSNLIPAFFLRETIKMDGQPLWRGWFTTLFAPEAKPAILDVQLWCGFDLTNGKNQRFCNLVLPMPLFQRLQLRDVNSLYENGVTMSAPLVTMRLDGDGARIVGSQLTQHDFKTPKGKQQIATPKEFGLSFSVQGETEQISWVKLYAETVKLTLNMPDQTRFESQKMLWSKREIQGKDRWIFAEKGKPNFIPQVREFHRPQLVGLAYDFLKPGTSPRIHNDLRDWVIAILTAHAIQEIDEEGHQNCSKIFEQFLSIKINAKTEHVAVQNNSSRNKQAILVDQYFCPTEVLPLLFVETWARF